MSSIEDQRFPNGRPVPDPTVLTTEQLLRAIAAERDYVEGQLDVLRERLLGIDRATELRLTGIPEITSQIDEKVAYLSRLAEQRFDSISLQFKERDTRSERESRDNKVAVDAAFAAQKEAASEQNKSNTLAITKSEIATMETINKLAELFQTSTRALAGKIDDLKERVSRIENRGIGAIEHRTENRAATSSVTTILGAVFALILIIFTFLNYQANREKTPAVVTPVPTVTVTTPSTTP